MPRAGPDGAPGQPRARGTPCLRARQGVRGTRGLRRCAAWSGQTVAAKEQFTLKFTCRSTLDRDDSARESFGERQGPHRG
jgi:hypothetical protein